MTSDMERDTRMLGGWLRGTGFLLSGLVLLGLATVAPANADGRADATCRRNRCGSIRRRGRIIESRECYYCRQRGRPVPARLER